MAGLELEVRALLRAVVELDRQLPARARPALLGLPQVRVATGSASMRERARVDVARGLDSADRPERLAVDLLHDGRAVGDDVPVIVT
jgi:hypothetical protein